LQRFIIHPIRNDPKYVCGKDRKSFLAGLKGDAWDSHYATAVHSERHAPGGKTGKPCRPSWSTPEDPSPDLHDRRRGRISWPDAGRLLKVFKTKGAFRTCAAVRKLPYLTHTDIIKNWNAPMRDWAKIQNQLAILFQGRLPAWHNPFAGFQALSCSSLAP
jgi:hypothetical protein